MESKKKERKANNTKYKDEKVKVKSKSEVKFNTKLTKKSSIIEVNNGIVKEVHPSKFNLEATIQMAFFRKYYWKKRNIIFQELFNLLGDSSEQKSSFGNKKEIEESEKETEEEDDLFEDYSDIENFNEEDFKIFLKNDNDEKKLENIEENKKERGRNIDEEEDNKEEDNEEEKDNEEGDNEEEEDSEEEKDKSEEENNPAEKEEDSESNINSPSNDFLKNSKKNILNKYQTNYCLPLIFTLIIF